MKIHLHLFFGSEVSRKKRKLFPENCTEGSKALVLVREKAIKSTDSKINDGRLFTNGHKNEMNTFLVIVKQNFYVMRCLYVYNLENTDSVNS